MADKPTENLNFAPDDAKVVPIPPAKQLVGFVAGEKPPARYLNWLFRTFTRLYNYVRDGNFTGNHTISGSLEIGGNAIVDGTLQLNAQVITDVDLAAGRKVRHGTRTKLVPILPPAVTAGPIPSRSVTISGNGSGANPLHVDLHLEVGITLVAVRVRLQDNVTGSSSAHFRLLNTLGAIATSNTSAGNGSEQTIQTTGLAHTVVGSTYYTVIVEGVVGSANITVIRLEYDYQQLA